MNITIPVSWLREYLKTDVAAKTIANYLSLCGPSVDHVKKVGEDYIFDVEVTSNRPDVFSIYGLAREAYAILISSGQKAKLQQPNGLKTSLEPDSKNQLHLEVSIKNISLCPRFSAIIIDNLKIKPSPSFIKNRLQACGIRPINNIVDISNYIMLELGQPMHTFDWDKIKGAKMILRQSKPGESIKTLDGQTRKLPAGSIVIEDKLRLIDLCGIMGGENSQITKRTKRVVLFVQAYDQEKIRKTTQALALRTEAAVRFEKGIDLDGIIPALSRAVYLAKVTAGAKIASELIDIYKNPIKSKSIILNLKKLNSYLGVAILPHEANKILKLLGFTTKLTQQTIVVQPPSWRIQDCLTEEDLIEEIARVHGYHNLPSILPAGSIPQTEENDLGAVITLKNALKYLGLTEIISNSFISKKFLELTQTSPHDAVELSNPLSQEWQFMRPTILISLINVIAQNQNIKQNLQIFEVAKTYLPPETSVDIPKQDLGLAIALNQSDFYQIKGLVENVMKVLKRPVTFEKPKNLPALFEKGACAQIKIAGTVIGTLGMLSTDIVDYFALKMPIAIAEINLTTSYRQPATDNHFKSIAKFPAIVEDISAIFDQKIPIAQITALVEKVGEPLVKNIEIVDIFINEKIGRNKKSVTIRLTYQKSDKTPTQVEVTRFRQIVVSHLESDIGAKVRKS